MARLSLATRIGVLFAVVTAVVFSIAGVHLYRSMSQQLESHDDEMLLSTVNHLRRRVAEIAEVEAVRMDPYRLLDAVAERGMLLAIRDSSDRPLLASAPEAVLPSVGTSVPADRDPDSSAIQNWRGADGRRGRVIAAWARIARPSADLVQLVVVRDGAESHVMLLKHRGHVLLALVLGVLAAAPLGYAIARHGLRPVRMVARAAGGITAEQLGERLRIEDAPAELVEMVQAFNRMLDRLEDSFRRLTQFSSDLAHDLRTPIGNLMIATQVALAQRRSIPEYETLLASNIEEYERLTRMIENMLFLARADNAQVALRAGTFSVEPELKRITEYFEGVADENGITLDVAASGTLVADPILFRRAVSNLVANAIRHSPSGARILVRGHEQHSDNFLVSVANPGSGIPPEQLPKIFDRFYRVDDSRRDSQFSSGLGLAIVKSIMTLHGGTVGVKSEPGGLTTFSLVFPSG